VDYPISIPALFRDARLGQNAQFLLTLQFKNPYASLIRPGSRDLRETFG
jgi:hypothetical protein